MAGDAEYGFATGFAQGFTSTFTARMQAEAAQERDKIRFGAQAWLQKENQYNAAKRADEAIMSQAEALVESESLIPNDAVIDIYNMLKAGRTPKMIIDDVRTSGAKFEDLPKPTDGSELTTPDISNEIEQTDAMMGMGDDTKLSPAGENSGVVVPSSDEKSREDTSTAPKDTSNVSNDETDPNNPFTQYNKEIREAVGQTDGDYFDQVLAGYSPEVKPGKYKFTPGVTKTDVPSLEQMLARSVYDSPEFKKAVADGDTAKQQELILKGIQSKKGDAGGLDFGTGGVAASMNVWALTEEGKTALANNDSMAIAKQWAKLNEVVNPSSESTSGKPKKDFDLQDLEGSFMNLWENSEAGKKAIDENDQPAILEAIAASHEQAHNVRLSMNKGYGFNPEDVKDLNQLPGLRQKYKDVPTVLTQLNEIEEGLLDAKRNETAAGDKGKDYTVYGIVDGKLTSLGTGTRKAGKLYMNGDEVPVEDASKFFLSSVDNPIDAEKIAASDWVKKKDKLYGTVDLANTALYYLAELEQNELARTYVARLASGAGEMLKELQALKDLSTVINEAGDEVIVRDTLIREIKTNPAFKDFSAGVRSIIAQETALIFDIARADGNSGHALSNKDYDNYFKSIFNSNDPEVIKANLERKVGLAFQAAVSGAKSIGNNPGMKYAVTGTGAQWWQSPKETVLEGREAPLQNFIESSLLRVKGTVESSSYGSTPSQLLDQYLAGETITVTQELIDAYPSFLDQSFLGRQMTAPKTGDN